MKTNNLRGQHPFGSDKHHIIDDPINPIIFDDPLPSVTEIQKKVHIKCMSLKTSSSKGIIIQSVPHPIVPCTFIIGADTGFGNDLLVYSLVRIIDNKAEILLSKSFTREEKSFIEYTKQIDFLARIFNAKVI